MSTPTGEGPLDGRSDLFAVGVLDRKSTRLNSSHLGISYAVFCLKKKNKQARVLAVVGLGRNTFLQHTHQKASVLFIRRNMPNQDPGRDYRLYVTILKRNWRDYRA